MVGPPPPVRPGAGRRRRGAAGPGRAAGRTAARTRSAVDCIAAVGGGGAPGVELPSAAVSLPERYAARAARGNPAVVGRMEAGRCLLDLRTVRPRTTTGLLLTAVAERHVRNRHRRARRPREVHARAPAHRHVARPVGRGAAPRADHRAGFRVDRDRRAAVRVRRRAGSRAIRREHARRRGPGAGGDVRRRRDRGLDAAVRGASRGFRRARRSACVGGDQQGRSRRSGARHGSGAGAFAGGPSVLGPN